MGTSRSSDGGHAESVFEEFLRRLEAGEDVDIDRTVLENPEHADSLREQWSDYCAFNEVAEDLAWMSGERGEGNPAPDLSRPELWQTAAIRRLMEGLAARRAGAQHHATGDRFDRGGMGELRDGWDPILNRGVAVKRILPQHQETGTDRGRRAFEATVARFLSEAQITAQLGHPGVVPIYDVGLDDDGQLFITMPKIEGQTLDEIFGAYREGDGDWPLVRVLGLVVRVAETVAYAHTRGIVHRDLKPANIMIGPHGEVYVMDWGLAAEVGERSEAEIHTLRGEGSLSQSPLITAEGGIAGTPAYMAPEQADGGVAEPRWDVYALGALLYELLAGERPYAELQSAQAIVAAVRERSTRSLSRTSTVPAELISITERAMARRAEDRYAGAEDLARDLRAFLEGRVVSAYETGALAELRKWVQRNRAVAASAAVAIVAVFGATAWTLNASARAAEKDTEAAESRALATAKELELEQQTLESTRLLLAQQSFAAAEQAMRRGDYETALAEIDRAEENGYAKPRALTLLRSDALAALQQTDSARSLLEQLVADLEEEGDEEYLGRALVRLATQGWSADRIEAAALDAQLDRALGMELPEVERLIAEAHRAGHTGEALEYLRRAIAVEPFQRYAYGEYLGLLFFCGQFDELRAQAHVYELLFPGDPLPVLCGTMAAVVERDRDLMEAELERLEGRVPEDTRKALRTIVRGVDELYEILGPDLALGGHTPLALSKAFTQVMPNLKHASGTLAGEFSFNVVPRLPSVEKVLAAFNVYEGVGELNLKKVLGVLANPRGLLDRMSASAREAAEVHDDGAIEFLAVLADGDDLVHAIGGETDPKKREELARGYLDRLETALDMPTPLHAVTRVGRYYTILFKLQMGTSVTFEQEELRGDFAWFLARDDLGKTKEIPGLIDFARRRGFHDIALDLADRLLDGERRHGPRGDPGHPASRSPVETR